MPQQPPQQPPHQPPAPSPLLAGRAAAARHRRRVLATGLAAALIAATAELAGAEEPFPSRPPRLVVPFAPGGVTDASARVVADALGQRLGQQVVVDNKPGASGNIGSAQVVAAVPDGYTLLLAYDGTMVINPHVFAKLPFDTLRDFAPIGKIGSATLVLAAHPSLSARTLKDVIALSKAQPGGLAFGTSGIGGTPHVAGEMLVQRSGAKLEHVPYKGGGPAITDAIGGAIPLVFTAVAGAQGHVKSGKLRAIAVSSAQHSPALPDVPTFIESGQPDFVVDSWVGLLAPAKTPAPVLAKLNGALNAVLADPQVRDQLGKLGIDTAPGSAEKFRDQLRRDLAAYGPIVKAANIKLD